MKISDIKIQILFLLFPVLLLGQTAFEQANELYQKEQFEEAAQGYEQILASGQHSTEVYFNLANAYYKLNQIAPAIYNYEKALLLSPNNSKIKNNLSFAQNMTIDDIKELPKVGFVNWVSEFTSVYYFDTWAKIAVVFSCLFLLSFVGYYFMKKTSIKRFFFAGMLLWIVLCISSILIATFEKKQAELDNPAIVFAESVVLTSEPNQSGSSVAVIHEGAKVYVLESVDEYYKVELLNGTEGWLIKSAVKRLKQPL